MEPAAEGGTDDWGEVVTRYPYRKVRMDHLLSKEQFAQLIESNFALAFLFSFERSNSQDFFSSNGRKKRLFCPLKTG